MIRSSGLVLPVLSRIRHLTVAHRVVSPDPESVKRGDVPDEPLDDVVDYPGGLGEAADPEAVVAPVPGLIPVIEALHRIAIPLVDAGIVGVAVPLPGPEAVGDRLARAMLGAFLACLAELDDAPRGLGACGER